MQTSCRCDFCEATCNSILVQFSIGVVGVGGGVQLFLPVITFVIIEIVVLVPEANVFNPRKQGYSLTERVRDISFLRSC